MQVLWIFSDCPDEFKLLKRGHTIIKTDFLGDLAVLDAKDGRPGKMHFATRFRGKRTDEEITERWTCVRASAFPTPDYMITFGDKIRRAAELEIRESLTKAAHERSDVIVATARIV